MFFYYLLQYNIGFIHKIYLSRTTTCLSRCLGGGRFRLWRSSQVFGVDPRGDGWGHPHGGGGRHSQTQSLRLLLEDAQEWHAALQVSYFSIYLVEYNIHIVWHSWSNKLLFYREVLSHISSIFFLNNARTCGENEDYSI